MWFYDLAAMIPRLTGAAVRSAQKLVTRRSFGPNRLFLVVVSTAATNGVLPGARPRLPPGAFAAEIGVVDLNPAGQPLARVRLEHDLLQLVFDLPGGGLRHPKATTQLDAGDALLGLSGDDRSHETTTAAAGGSMQRSSRR